MANFNKVLIVEDEEILAANILTHVQRRGWEARIAPTGKQAVSALDEFMPQVILLDYHLPDMNGFQMLDEARANHAACGCVLMTGHPTEALMADARRHGIESILCKPFAFADMETSLHTAGENGPITSLPEDPAERRQHDRRRSLVHFIFGALRLRDGTWLTDDRRQTNRRK